MTDTDFAAKSFKLRFECSWMRFTILGAGPFSIKANRCLSFVVVVAGAAAVADLGALLGLHHSAQVLAFVATVAGALQLVFNFGERARIHEFLQRRYYELIAEIAETQSPQAPAFAKWEGALFRFYAEEPPSMRALDAMAYNAALLSIKHNPELAKLKIHERLLSQFWRFDAGNFPSPEPPKQL